MLCDTFTKEQVRQRSLGNFYRSTSGGKIFEVIVSAYYQVDFEEEFADEIDELGKITLSNGVKATLEQIKWDAFNILQNLLIDSKGK